MSDNQGSTLTTYRTELTNSHWRQRFVFDRALTGEEIEELGRICREEHGSGATVLVDDEAELPGSAILITRPSSVPWRAIEELIEQVVNHRALGRCCQTEYVAGGHIRIDLNFNVPLPQRRRLAWRLRRMEDTTNLEVTVRPRQVEVRGGLASFDAEVVFSIIRAVTGARQLTHPVRF